MGTGVQFPYFGEASMEPTLRKPVSAGHHPRRGSEGRQVFERVRFQEEQVGARSHPHASERAGISEEGRRFPLAAYGLPYWPSIDSTSAGSATLSWAERRGARNKTKRPRMLTGAMIGCW